MKQDTLAPGPILRDSLSIGLRCGMGIRVCEKLQVIRMCRQGCEPPASSVITPQGTLMGRRFLVSSSVLPTHLHLMP